MNKHNVLKKGLVCGIFILFVGISMMPMVGSLSLEKIVATESLPWEYSSGGNTGAKTPTTTMLKPPETGVVCGYVTDIFSKEPIENAKIYLVFDSVHINTTYTNDSGFYRMNSPAGDISLTVHADGYRWDYPFHCTVEENRTTWKNISKIPFPPFNSIVCGYITDEITQEPIEGVYCTFFWVYYGVACKMMVVSDSHGFYRFNVPATEFSLWFELDGYFTQYGGGWILIEENETKWVNISMYPYPPENSIVCGYVTDFATNEPIDNAEIYIEWHCEHGDREYWTIANNQGFYSENIAEGTIVVHAWKEGYRVKSSYVTVGENDTVWVNFSLSKSRNRIVTNLLLFQIFERFPLLEKVLLYLIK